MDTGSQPVVPQEEVLAYLDKRRHILEGVCVTGGEPTLYPDLPELIQKIKSLGFAVKLDTNGTNPDMVKGLVNERLIDYIAMDIKNSREKYALTCGKYNISLGKIEESVSWLLTGPVDYEFRTTVVKELHEEEDMISIGQWIAGAKAYYLQCYKDSGDVISPGFSAPSEETLRHYLQVLKPYIKNVELRGVD